MMHIQWHLLFEQLRQADTAYDSLANDISDTGTQADHPGTVHAESGLALKALHQKLGNRGFEELVNMKKAAHEQSQDTDVNQAPDSTSLTLSSLLQKFVYALPSPASKLWQLLEIQYLQLEARPQRKLVKKISDLINALSTENKEAFLTHVNAVSHLHIVQAIIAKVLFQIHPAHIAAKELEEPTIPDED